MNTEKFTAILAQKETIKQLETIELKSIVEKHPYFQTARALYLKGLQNQDSFKYNNELKITAAHTLDRTVLFNFITSANFNAPQKTIHTQISEKITAAQHEDILAPKTKNKKNIPEETNDMLRPGKPISFTTSENYSFNEWLTLTSKKTILRSKKKEIKPNSKKEELINKFINENPKIEPLSKGKTITIPVKENKQDAALMTETLAKVYLEQKKYESAIQAFRILSLKYPEKSGFFADQIKRVQILQKNKS